MTVVAALQSGGILRVGGIKSGFRYRYARGGRPGRRDVERISTLRIPPAWTSVAIDPSGHAWIQAVGRDKAGRWQYVYHARAVARRERRKHDRLLAFTRNLPRLRAQVARDLARNDYGQEHVLACMMRVLSLCFLRPGSEEYASENGSYGITTLRPRHVQVRGSVVRFRFTAKSGKNSFHEIEDRRVAATVRGLLAAGGRRVFTFRDASGEWKVVRRHHINAYIKEAMGGAFSAKDFRTWAGTITCACALARIGVDATDSPTALRKKVAAAVRETAENAWQHAGGIAFIVHLAVGHSRLRGRASHQSSGERHWQPCEVAIPAPPVRAFPAQGTRGIPVGGVASPEGAQIRGIIRHERERRKHGRISSVFPPLPLRP